MTSNNIGIIVNLDNVLCPLFHFGHCTFFLTKNCNVLSFFFTFNILLVQLNEVGDVARQVSKKMTWHANSSHLLPLFFLSPKPSCLWPPPPQSPPFTSPNLRRCLSRKIERIICGKTEREDYSGQN